MDQIANADGRRLEEYRDYLRLLARVHLSTRLKTKLDPSDIAQQAILEAHKCGAQCRGHNETEWLAWLRGILANVLAAAGRRFSAESRDLNRERSLEDELDLSSSRLAGVLAADQTSPSGQAVISEELSWLANAMNRLPEDQQRVVELHHLKGLQIGEIAVLMGRSRPAIAGLLFRGLSRLRELFPDPAEDET